MIDQVAKAIYLESLPPGIRSKAFWYAVDDHHKKSIWYPAAKAAILAMREPTPKMLIDSGCVEGYCDDSLLSQGADRDHIEWWKSMLETAANQVPVETGE